MFRGEQKKKKEDSLEIICVRMPGINDGRRLSFNRLDGFKSWQVVRTRSPRTHTEWLLDLWSLQFIKKMRPEKERKS